MTSTLSNFLSPFSLTIGKDGCWKRSEAEARAARCSPPPWRVSLLQRYALTLVRPTTGATTARADWHPCAQAFCSRATIWTNACLPKNLSWKTGRYIFALVIFYFLFLFVQGCFFLEFASKPLHKHMYLSHIRNSPRILLDDQPWCSTMRTSDSKHSFFHNHPIRPDFVLHSSP